MDNANACPHCGAELLGVSDVFCPECREELHAEVPAPVEKLAHSKSREQRNRAIEHPATKVTGLPANQTTSREWFGVGVRLFALWPLYRSVQYFLLFFDFRRGYSSVTPDPDFGTTYLLHAFAYFIFALLLLRAAPFLVAFSYPDLVADSDDDEDNQEEPTDTVE